MNKASATSSPEPNKTEKMLLIAKNYWDYTTQPIVFVAPTMVIAADIRNRFFRLIESCNTVLENPRRVRCLSLCEPDGLKSLLGKQNTAFFFDHTCLERSDLLEAAGKLVNAIWENRSGEAVTSCHAGFIGALAKRVPCPWGREDGRETFYPATGCIKPSVDLKPRHEVDKQRTASILQAMIRHVRFDKAIPEEWMDELSDLAWRERDRLGGNNA